MQPQRKISNLLQGLKPAERHDFLDFLRSPFFNSNPSFAVFFKRLCEQCPTAFSQGEINWKKVFQKAFPEREFSAHKLDNVLSSMSGLVLQYFAVREAFPVEAEPPKAITGKARTAAAEIGLPDSPPPGQNRLCRALGKRNLFAAFQAECNSLIASLEALPVKQAEDFSSLRQMHHLLYAHPDSARFQAHPAHLLAAMDNLDLHFCLEKLRYAAEIKMREHIFPDRREIALLAQVLDITAEPALQARHPLIAFYHKLVRLHDGGLDEQAYRDLKNLFLENFALFPPAEQFPLLQNLINYGIFLSEQQHCPVEGEMLALYKKGWEAGILRSGDRLTHGVFTNAVVLAGICGELDWAETFMQEGSLYLEPSAREMALSWCNAYLNYCQGRLGKSQEQLQNAKLFSTPGFDFRARGLQLKIAFDLYVQQNSTCEFFTSSLRAYGKHLRSQELSESKKRSFRNFCGFVRRMATIKSKAAEKGDAVSTEQKQALRQKLAGLQQVVSKHWLAEKIEGL